MSQSAFFVNQVRQSTLRALNYSPRVERLRDTPKRKSVPLQSLMESMGPAYGTVFTRIDCLPEYGVELLSQSDMFGAEPQGRVIRRDSMAHPERHRVERLQVLVAGAGTLGENELYGRALLADSRLQDKYVGPDSMSLSFREPDSDQSLFSFAFLASPTGTEAIRSTSYGTKLLRFREDLFGSLPVPVGEGDVARRVARLVRRCTEQRESYIRLLHAAGAVLEQADPRLGRSVGLYGRGAWPVELRGGVSTIAARNHRPAASAFPEGVSLSTFLKNGRPRKANRFTRTPCNPKHGRPFLGQRDLFLIRPIPQHIRPPSSVEGLHAEFGSIIIAAAGQSGESTLFGRCELGDHFAGCLVSEHTLHLLVDADAIDHRYLFALLHSPWGIGALKSCATGTSVPSLDPTLLGSLKVPRLDSAVEAAVAGHIENAYHARADAERAEATAIETIEEEVLPKWLG